MNVLKIPLLPVSVVYALVVEVRNRFFEVGIFPSRALGAPTISVGNLSVGGTGKTPIVAYVAHYLHRKGKRVAILSRGYRRKSGGFVLVSGGRQLLVDSRTSGDEPYELARELPGVIVGVHRHRVRAAEAVLRQFPVDVFLLDDGFQHRWARRNLDIVAISAEPGFSSFLLPAGKRREPLKSLRRAQHVAFTRAGEMGSAPATFEEMKKRYGRFTHADFSAVDFTGRSLIRLASGVEDPIKKFRGKKAFLFCGIADPRSFETLVKTIGIDITGKKYFRDHYDFRDQDFSLLKNNLHKSEADILLTTLKDAARLSGSEEGKLFVIEEPVYGLAIDVRFVQGEAAFHDHLDRLFQ